MKNNKYFFKWDTFSIVITSLIILVPIVIVTSAPITTTFERIGTGVVIALLIFPAFLCPLNAELDGNTLHIRMPLHVKHIDLNEYTVTRSKQEDHLCHLRLCASGGYFGYWGLWRSSDGTKYISYITSHKDNITILIPKDPKKKQVWLNLPVGFLPQPSTSTHTNEA